MRVYLSGPIERVAEDSDLDWFSEAENYLRCAGLEVFNPMRVGCDLLVAAGLGKTAGDLLETETPVEWVNRIRLAANAEFLAMKKDPEQLDRFRALMNMLIEKDMFEVAKCHVVVVHISPAIAGGTSGEITLARHLKIPVVAFLPQDPCTCGGWNLGIPDTLFVGKDAYDNALNYVIDHRDELEQPDTFMARGLI